MTPKHRAFGSEASRGIFVTAASYMHKEIRFGTVLSVVLLEIAARDAWSYGLKACSDENSWEA
jgi:hypothetical protein